MPGLYELGVFNTEMNTVQRRVCRLPVDGLKVAAYMPLRHNLPLGIVYGRPVIPSSSHKTASSRQSPACASRNIPSNRPSALLILCCFGLDLEFKFGAIEADVELHKEVRLPENQRYIIAVNPREG